MQYVTRYEKVEEKLQLKRISVILFYALRKHFKVPSIKLVLMLVNLTRQSSLRADLGGGGPDVRPP